MQNAYEKARKRARELYHSVRYVHSHALNERVYFTATGFKHLLFKTSQVEREHQSQMQRFKLLSRAIKLIGLSTVYQEYEKEVKRVSIKVLKKRVARTKVIKYWGIIGIVEGIKIKVVLRKVGNSGELHFWSVMPAWTSSRRDQKLLHSFKK